MLIWSAGVACNSIPVSVYLPAIIPPHIDTTRGFGLLATHPKHKQRGRKALLEFIKQEPIDLSSSQFEKVITALADSLSQILWDICCTNVCA